MKTLIQNGRVIDPASGLDEVADIAIAGGKILAITKKGEFSLTQTGGGYSEICHIWSAPRSINCEIPKPSKA